MTTAILRAQALEAEKRCDWREAARLFDEAAAAYPTSARLSKLVQADILALQNRAVDCRISSPADAI